MLVFTGVRQIGYLDWVLILFDSDQSFSPICVDGEISKNDLIYILANGAAFNGFIIDEENTKVLKRELTDFATDLTKLVAKARQVHDSYC